MDANGIQLQYLPAFAAYLLANHLDAFTSEMLRVSREEDLPLLRFLDEFPDEQVLEIGRKSTTELLEHMASNRLRYYIDKAASDWVANKLPLIDRKQIIAADITRLSLVRRKVFRDFLKLYTRDVGLFANIMEDMDRFVAAQEAASLVAYISIHQEALLRSEELYKQAEAITHIGNWSWNVNSDIVSWSDEMYRIYGLEPQEEEISFDRFISMVHPEDRAQRISDINESLESGVVKDYTLRIINPGGRVRVLKGKGEVITDSNNRPVKLIGTCQDITVEHSLIRELKEKQEHLDALINNAPDAVIVIDEDSSIRLWNPKTEEIFGWTAAEATGMPLTEMIIPHRYREAYEASIHRLLAREDATILNKTLEIIARTKNGQELYVAIKISRMREEGRTLFIAFLRDITREKQIQQELRNKTILLEHKNAELNLINEELESFNYAASHDLQEPLRKIQTFGSRILSKVTDEMPEPIVADIRRIMSSAARMQQLIQDLLTFSQITASIEIAEVVDLVELLEEVRKELHPLPGEPSFKLEVSPLPVVSVVRFQFKQLFENLVSNSIKYKKEDEPAEIRVSGDLVELHDSEKVHAFANSRYLRITVTDNGIGFEQEYAEKIFELFSRLHHNDAYPGTGIGLTICKKIAHNHGGFIKAESEKGRGASFHIYLPESIIVTDQKASAKLM